MLLALPSFLPSFPSPFFLVQRRWRSDVWKEAKLEIHSFHSAIRLLRSPAMHAATQSTFKKGAPHKRGRRPIELGGNLRGKRVKVRKKGFSTSGD